jgi:hypothetical protein
VKLFTVDSTTSMVDRIQHLKVCLSTSGIDLSGQVKDGLEEAELAATWNQRKRKRRETEASDKRDRPQRPRRTEKSGAALLTPWACCAGSLAGQKGAGRQGRDWRRVG